MKPTWTPISDPKSGKYREYLSFWILRNGQVWVLKRDSTGKRG